MSYTVDKAIKKVIDTYIILDEYDFDGLNNIVSALELIKKCKQRYLSFSDKLDEAIDLIDEDHYIKDIVFSNDFNCERGIVLSVILKDSLCEKMDYSNIIQFLYKDDEINYYEENYNRDENFDVGIDEIKNVFLNNSKYTNLLKFIGNYIKEMYQEFAVRDITGDFELRFGYDKFVLSLHSSVLYYLGKRLSIYYFYDENRHFSLRKCKGYNFVNSGKLINFIMEKYMVIKTDVGNFYIDSNVNGINKLFSVELDNEQFEGEELNSMLRLISNIYVNKRDLPDFISDSVKVRKRVRKNEKNGN